MKEFHSRSMEIEIVQKTRGNMKVFNFTRKLQLTARIFTRREAAGPERSRDRQLAYSGLSTSKVFSIIEKR